jgi:hypothetical protein
MLLRDHDEFRIHRRYLMVQAAGCHIFDEFQNLAHGDCVDLHVEDFDHWYSSRTLRKYALLHLLLLRWFDAWSHAVLRIDDMLFSQTILMQSVVLTMRTWKCLQSLSRVTMLICYKNIAILHVNANPDISTFVADMKRRK